MDQKSRCYNAEAALARIRTLQFEFDLKADDPESEFAYLADQNIEPGEVTPERLAADLRAGLIGLDAVERALQTLIGANIDLIEPWEPPHL